MFLRHTLAFLLAIGCSVAAGAEQPKPLRVLWCTGGGFHDYNELTPRLTAEIQKHANVHFDVVSNYKAWAKTDFAAGYDAVVYYFSYHDKAAKPIVNDQESLGHVDQPVRQGPRLRHVAGP